MNTNNNKPNNFSVVPAAVLLNDTITDKAKILYSEISALCNKKGYCWATNKDFAEQYKCTIQYIIKLIKSLENNNHIKVERTSNSRKIYINNLDKRKKTSAYSEKNVIGGLNNLFFQTKQKDTHNNIKNNINNNNGFANVKTVCSFDEKIKIYDITEKIIDLYFDIYEEYNFNRHPALTAENKLKVQTKLSAFIDEYDWGNGFDSDLELWENMIIAFFNNVKSDGNINLFSEEEILKNRYYETGGGSLDY